jgi:Putative Ig domain
MKKLLLFFGVGVCLSAQTTVYLKTSGPALQYVTGASNSGVTPFHLIINSTAGLTVGDLIEVNNVCANDGVNYISVANGVRKISAINSSTDLTITDQVGNALTSNGNWCSGATTGLNGGTTVGKLTAYSLTAKPRGWFDGPTGAHTRAFMLGTNNGLSSLVCASNVCTVTTSYNHGLAAGNHIAISGTGTALDTIRSMAADWVVNSSGLTATQFTFNATVANGTYTHNDHCGPGATPNGTRQGTDNCVLISQLATQNNPNWINVWNSLTSAYPAGGKYKSIIDDSINGTLGTASSVEPVVQNIWAPIAMEYLVDPSYDTSLAAIQYMLNNVERLGGAGFYANEQVNEGGDGELTDYGSYVWRWLAPVYQAGSVYLTTAQRTAFLNKIYNDITDATPCTRNLYTRESLAASTAQGGNFTTFTLNASDAKANNYYSNNVIEWVSHNGTHETGLVTGYVAATKVATVSSWSGFPGDYLLGAMTVGQTSITLYYGTDIANGGIIRVMNDGTNATEDLLVVSGGGTPNLVVTRAQNGTSAVPHNANSTIYIAPQPGVAYNIYSTITMSGNTITGYNTSFQTDVGYGDVVYAANSWVASISFPSFQGAYVTSNPPSSNTSLAVVSSSSSISGTPQTLWIAKHQTNNAWCGLKWKQAHWSGSPSSQPISYGADGGSQTSLPGTTGNMGTSVASNNGSTWVNGHMLLDLVTADEEPRAITDLATSSNYWWDYEMAFLMTYVTGVSQSGSHYSWARTLQDGPGAALNFQNSVVGFPSMDPTGPWVTAPSIFKMFTGLPDTPYSASISGGTTQFEMLFGQAAADSVHPGQAGANWLTDFGSAFSPSANSSKYLQNFFTTKGMQAWAHGAAVPETAIFISQNSPTLNYTTQPHQYWFSATSHAACDTLFGGTGNCPYPQGFRADVMISRTGWGSTTDTWLGVQARSFCCDHDSPQPGTTLLYKAGYLLGNDTFLVGSSDVDNGTGLFDPTKNDVTPEFGGTNSLKSTYPNPMIMNSIRWASANSGTWPAAYGDQNSAYAAEMLDFSGAYTTTYNRVQRTMVHFKKAGTEEFLIQYDDIDATGHATQIRNQVHYTQNGETLTTNPWGFYAEGTTTCPGTGGCGSLNTNRSILEQQSGTNDGHGDPTPQYNLISNFVVPSGAPNLFVHFDGNSYSGSNNHTNRVSLCADASSTGACGAGGQTKLEDIIVHKVATQPDTALTTTALNPDVNWGGVQAKGATDTKIALFARGGVVHSSITPFTPSYAGTAQWLISGVTPGTYTPNIGGTPVASCNGTAPPCTVTNGDNTIYFESTAGAFSMSGTPATCSITSASLPGGTVGVSYAQSMSTVNCTAPLTWSLISGSLPNGLTLNSSTGAISGTPSGAPATSNFTIQVADSAGATPNQPISIAIDATLAVAPATWNGSCFVGAPGPNQTVTIGTSGGILGAWTDSITGSPWLTTSAASGNGNSSVTAMISCAALTPGSYTGTISVNATGGNNNPKTSVVTLTVSTPPGSSRAAGSKVSAGTIRH